MGNAESGEIFSSGAVESIDRRCSISKQSTFVPDNFSSLEEVTTALRDSGLESSNLILGIDFTKSNEWTGKLSFNRNSLHAISSQPNPYEQAISIVGQTLSSFDEDNLIPCFGFGDASTHDQHVFSFFPDHRPCYGFEEVLTRYREIVPHLELSGPTSFAPLIHVAISIVERSNWQYHVLLIIADGQVTRNPNRQYEQYSTQELATIDAIVAASNFPLSIVMVGVGDGPWDAMQHFDDHIPKRSFDNFQFVNFTKIMSSNKEMVKKEAAFALAALMEIPFQFRAAQGLRPDKHKETFVSVYPLPPPPRVLQSDGVKAFSYSSTLQVTKGVAQSSDSGNSISSLQQVCPICLTNPRDMAFNCGHLTCRICGQSVTKCPICRAQITTRLKLYT